LKSLRYSGWVRFRNSPVASSGFLLQSRARALALKSLRFSSWVCFANSPRSPGFVRTRQRTPTTRAAPLACAHFAMTCLPEAESATLSSARGGLDRSMERCEDGASLFIANAIGVPMGAAPERQ
jgi:hypothetical protein